ncbi:putative GTP-binding protein 6 [Rhineura floridana]|uniref:putative GTP-binding protein 6 n=1 Tax=Rhineura floridana TaxID=261503 RepID=UPI002AC88F54|nr:putative GTP-binding protein 6 [Rhineura floridana]
MGSRWRQMLLWGRKFHVVFPLPPARCLGPSPVRFLHATAINYHIPKSGNGHAKGRRGGNSNCSSWESGNKEGEEEDEEEEDDDKGMLDVNEKLLESGLPPLFLDSQKVFIVHPAVKWGAGKPQLTRAELQLAEAVALISTIQNWTVVDKIILSTKVPDKKFIFGKGNFQLLTEKIKGSPNVSSVFVNVERLSPLTKKELEEAWQVKVFDRYTVVLHIFRCNARTKEAKLQIALAEIPLLRTNVTNEVAQLDQQRGGSRYIMGSGETFMEMQVRLLKEKELKIRKALEKLKRKRRLLRSQRRKREFPVISVMGYTNCGKTTLIKALTGDAGLQPQDQLFATLDITAHAGNLPSRLTVLYVDTIGFLSQLPHDLVQSFSATLEDVACSDLIIHVRDVSHPETNLQKESVLSVLRNLNLPNHLLETIIEVHNKVDLIDRYHPIEPNAIAISALLGHGLEELKKEIESTILTVTGKNILTIKINLSGPQLSWLYKEATVQEVDVVPENGTANIKVIISNSALGKYKRLFPQSCYSSCN